MNRLLQGEVGSGKTIIAVRAMLQAVDAAGQAVLLAPTEVLAQQHYRSITSLLGPLAQGGQLGGAEHATRVALLTGSLGGPQPPHGAAGRRLRRGRHRHRHARAAGGERPVRRPRAGRHRRAAQVRRRAAGRAAGQGRRRAAAPAGHDRHPDPAHRRHDRLRRPGHLHAHRAARRAAAHRHARRARRRAAELPGPDLGADPRGGRPGPPGLHRLPAYRRRPGRRRRRGQAGRPGRGAAPGASPNGGLLGAGRAGRRGRPAAGSDRRPRPGRRSWATAELAGLRLGVMHGRLPPEEKDQVMLAFAEGELDVLVTTTVVEVGVDVPNATVMVIMDADRFGVSQLHQLRGRVGRGRHEGLCLLVTEAPADSAGAGAAGRGGQHLRRLPAVPDRPGTAPGGRRARHRPGRPPDQPEAAAAGPTTRT